jgi:hypothetical protein
MLTKLTQPVVLLAATVCVGFSGPLLASPTEIACTWRAPANASADTGEKEAAKFFSYPNELAYFRLNTEKEKAENADPRYAPWTRKP